MPPDCILTFPLLNDFITVIGKFHCVHPTPANAVYYTGLYRSVRFSDHLLAHWVMHGGSRGKYGKCIPHKYRPLSSSNSAGTAGKIMSSPDKSLTSPHQRQEYSGSSAVNRARAKSAGRTTSATQRGSTYNPSSLPTALTAAPGPSEKSRGSLVNTYNSEPQMNNISEGHASRRQLHEEQQLQLTTNDTQTDRRSKARGKSEPRKANVTPAAVASPQPSPRVVPKQAFLSPSARPALLPTTPSSVRSRLESGISKAAFYSAGIADLSLSPDEGRGALTDKKSGGKKQHQLQQGSECDEAACEESDEEERHSSSFSPSPSPRANSTAVAQRSTASSPRPKGDNYTPCSATTTAPVTASKLMARESASQKLMMRPSTSNSTLGRSDSTGSLRLEQSLLNAKANGSMNSMSSGPEDARSVHSRSPAPESATHSHSQKKARNTATATNVPVSVPVNVPVPVTRPAGRVETVRVPSPSLDPRSSSRPLLSEFAAFNEQIRARASASREDTRAYITHSSSHRAASPGNHTGTAGGASNKLEADSPLKQRRVSLVKTKSDVPASAATSGTSTSANMTASGGKNVNSVITGGVQYGAHPQSSLSNHSHVSKTRSKQELLEEVHRTLFATPGASATANAAAVGNSVAPVVIGAYAGLSGGSSGGGGGSSSRSPVNNRHNNPLDPMLLQQAYQVTAHPSFSQPISPSNHYNNSSNSSSADRATGLLQTQQDKAFTQNPAVVKAGATAGKMIQYGNASAHPANVYTK